MNKSIFTIIFLVAALLVVMKIQSFIKNNAPAQPIPSEEETVFCTMDAMMCPDGTYVGRTGPNCEFKCPDTNASTSPMTFTVGLEESFEVASTTVSVWAVTEDSRCASDVVCIQMGRVTIGLNIWSPSGNSVVELEPGKSATTETLNITLDEVQPYPVSSYKISDQEYRFVFTVTKK